MIDKVEVRVPSAAQFSSDFGALYSDQRGDSNVFRESPHYIRVGDLRRFGYPAILHVHCRRDQKGNHKLELVDTAEMSVCAMQKVILRIFDVEPSHLGLMRIDLAADIPGVPVLWFRRNARVKWKQWMAEIGKVEYAEMGRRKVETLYFGKRPNCIRVYDKISELHHQYDQMVRRASDAAEIPTFEEQFHYPESGFVLTRVERQLAGGRVPERLDRISKLRTLPDFNPFDNIEFLGGDRNEPNHGGCSLHDSLTGRGLRALVDEMGIQRARAYLNTHSSGNAARYLRQYSAFLPGESGIDGTPTIPKLQGIRMPPIGRMKDDGLPIERGAPNRSGDKNVD